MGYVGLDRGIVDHWIYQDAEYFKVWFEMLYRARFSIEPEKKLIDNILVDMHYGEFVYGRLKWSDRLKVSERRLRTLIEKLIKDGMIEVVNNYPRFTVYRILNYAKYNQQNDQQENHTQQEFEADSDQQNDQRATSRRPADDQRATTKEEGIKKVNNDKKVNKELIYSPEFDSFWDSYPKQVGKPAAFNNWKKLLKKHTAEYLIACGMNYQSYCIANGTDNQYMKLPNNFLNAKEEYYKQFETPVLIHNTGQPKGKPSTTSRLQEMYRKAEEEEKREANGGY